MASYPNGNGQKVKVISIVHLATAVVFIIIGIVQLAAVDHWSSHVGFGLWGGVWIGLTGLVGYLSVRRNEANNQNNASACYIATHMSFSIVSTVMVGIMLIVFGIALSNFNDCLRCADREWDSYWHHYRHSYNYCPGIYGVSTISDCKTGKGLGAFTLALLLLEFILSILSAILCCSAVCCGPQQNNPQVVFVPAGGGVVQMQGGAVVGQAGQVAYIQQGQVPVVVPGANVPPTMQVVQQAQVPQYYPQPQTVQVPPQGWQQAPPAYSGAIATGVTPPESAGPLPQKN